MGGAVESEGFPGYAPAKYRASMAVMNRDRVSVPRDLAPLSRRQRQVAMHVFAGLSNREIAGALEISEKTVEAHLRKIFSKLGLRSRTQLAAYVARSCA
jgi:non-specific serine/threonine protein kinase